MSAIEKTSVFKQLGINLDKSKKAKKNGRKPLITQRQFIVKYNKSLMKGYQPKEMKKKTFSPNTISGGYQGSCPRYWWHAFNGGMFDTDFTPTAVERMKAGTDSHKRIQEILNRMDIVESTEPSIRWEDPPMHGFIDVVLVLDDGSKLVGDIKTTGADSVQERYKEQAPTASHELQVLLYMYMTDADEGFVLYEGPTPRMRKLMLPVWKDEQNLEYVESIMQWMRDVYSSWEENRMPKRCFDQASRVCSSCPLSETCWSDQEGTEDLGRLPIRD